MEQQNKFDVIIIGGGPAGYITAIQAIRSGLTTALIEKNKIGGSHLNAGIVPFRSMLESAALLERIRNVNEFGLNCGKAIPDWHAILKRAIIIASKLSKYFELRLQRKKVALFKGEAYLSNRREVTLTSNGDRASIIGKNIIIATGAKPVALPGVSFDDRLFISPAGVFNLPEIPKQLLIIDGNERGVELACLFAILGSHVTVIENKSEILPFMDIEVSRAIKRSLDSREIIIHTDAKVTGVIQPESKYQYIIEKPEGTFKIFPDTCIITTGMMGNTSDLGLEGADIKTMNGFIRVDGHLRTNITGIYALGNCVGPPRTQHAVKCEAACIIDSISGKGKFTVNKDNIPTCVYSLPEAASLGMSEVDATDAGYNIKVSKISLNTNERATTIGESDGFVKLIVDTDKDKLLGAHIVGPSATELIGEISLIMDMNIPLSKLPTSPHPSPTLSEAIIEAVEKVRNG